MEHQHLCRLKDLTFGKRFQTNEVVERIKKTGRVPKKRACIYHCHHRQDRFWVFDFLPLEEQARKSNLVATMSPYVSK